MPAWIVANRVRLNIRAVIGLGDVTEGSTIQEYDEALKGWNVIKASRLIYMPMRGNHDFPESLWNQYFGTKYFNRMAWFGGAYNNSTSCYYTKFTEGSQKYLVMAMGFTPNSSQIRWAQKVLNNNTDCKVIVAAHSYLDITGFTPEGTTLWNKLINNNKNIFLVVCGHMHYPYSVYLIGTGRNGNRVNELRVDYQDLNYGAGYMEILKFEPLKGRIETSTYSAYLNKTDPTGSYTMPLPRNRYTLETSPMPKYSFKAGPSRRIYINEPL